jgi:hypothetical protein
MINIWSDFQVKLFEMIDISFDYIFMVLAFGRRLAIESNFSLAGDVHVIGKFSV